MLTNHTNITVFCSKKVGRETIWNAFKLTDVNWHGTDQAIVGNQEIESSDSYIVRIPNNNLQNYVDKATYKEMPIEEISNCYTLKKDDYIVKGLVDCDINSSAEILRLDDVYRISEVVENLSASCFSRHIKVVVK